MRDVTTRLYLFSVFNNVEKSTNDLRHTNLLANLNSNGRQCIAVEGRYNGVDEKAILLTGDNNFESIVKDICDTHKQECFLIVYHDATAELVFHNGSRKVIGKWERIDASQSVGLKCLTKIDDAYYTVR